MSARWLIIVNPKAGRNRQTHRREKLVRRVRNALQAEVAYTQYPGHATELAAAARGFDGLAVLGGDGTIAEVVNGMRLERQTLLVLPGGTGNGLALDLGFHSCCQALATAHANLSRSIDLLRVTFRIGAEARSRLVISTAALGYAADVTAFANRHLKPLGALCYPVAATVQALRSGRVALTATVDGAGFEETRMSNLMINNTGYAGNFNAFPQARLNDGRMEVLLARVGGWQQLLHNLAVLSRTYFYATATETRVREATFKLRTPHRLMLDGEIWEAVTEARFEVLPGRLQCIA